MNIKTITYLFSVAPATKVGEIFAKVEADHPEMIITSFNARDEYKYPNDINKPGVKTGNKIMSVTLGLPKIDEEGETD